MMTQKTWVIDHCESQKVPS